MKISTAIGVLLGSCLILAFLWVFNIDARSFASAVVSLGLLSAMAVIVAWALKKEFVAELLSAFSAHGARGVIDKFRSSPDFSASALKYVAAITLATFISGLVALLSQVANIAVGLLQADRIESQTQIMKLQQDTLVQQNAISEATALSQLELTRRESQERLDEIEAVIADWDRLLFDEPSSDSLDLEKKAMKLQLVYCRKGVRCPLDGDARPVPVDLAGATDAFVNELHKQYQMRRSAYTLHDAPQGLFGEVNGYKEHLGRMATDAKRFCGSSDVTTSAFMANASKARYFEETVAAAIVDHWGTFERTADVDGGEFGVDWKVLPDNALEKVRSISQLLDALLMAGSPPHTKKAGKEERQDRLLGSELDKLLAANVEGLELTAEERLNLRLDGTSIDEISEEQKIQLAMTRLKRIALQSMRSLAVEALEIYGNLSHQSASIAKNCVSRRKIIQDRLEFIGKLITQVQNASPKRTP